MRLQDVIRYVVIYVVIFIIFRWLGVRLEFIGSCIVFSAILLAVISRNLDVKTLTAGIAGISITYALGVSCLYIV